MKKIGKKMTVEELINHHLISAETETTVVFYQGKQRFEIIIRRMKPEQKEPTDSLMLYDFEFNDFN